MKITFVGLGTEQLGISQLSSIIKSEGHEVSMAFAAMLFNDRFNLEFPTISPYFDDSANVVDAIRKSRPDVVAFSPLTGTYQWMLEIARHAKSINPSIKTVFGGVHASAVPERVLRQKEVDYVVVGEGDIAFPQILNNLRKEDYYSEIPNTRFKSPEGKVVRGLQKAFIQSLDDFPFYDKTIWEDYVRIGDLYLTMASRGCPYRCTFCFNNFVAKLPEEKSGKYVRLRSTEHMMAELRFAKKRYKLRWIDFQDDVFTTSKPWLKEFLAKYKKEINLPFQILTHPRFMDGDIARWLADAGCQWVQMGVQSMDEGFKKNTLLRYEKSDDVSAAIEVMQKSGMHVKVDHMFGLPDEPISAQESALKLYAETQPKRVQTFWTTFLPGTEMMNDAIKKGVLSEDKAEKINEGKEFFFFRNYTSIKDPALMNQYKAYEVVFRAIPILPEAIRRRMKPNHITRLPTTLLRPLSMLADIVAGFSLSNPEFSAYLKHNLYHLARFFMMRFGYKRMTATPVNQDAKYTYTTFKETEQQEHEFASLKTGTS